MALGYEFQPGQEKRLRGNLNRPGGGALSPAANEAIRILSMRMPTVLGGRPPAPADLLKPAMGGSGAPGAVVGSLLKSSGMDRPSGLQSPAPSLSTPSLASPTAQPFATSTPNEGARLSALVNESLSGGSPNVHITPGGEGDRKLPGEAPAPPAPTPTPLPGSPPASMSVQTQQPDASLGELLAYLLRTSPPGEYGAPGSFGTEG